MIDKDKLKKFERLIKIGEEMSKLISEKLKIEMELKIWIKGGDKDERKYNYKSMLLWRW